MKPTKYTTLKRRLERLAKSLESDKQSFATHDSRYYKGVSTGLRWAAEDIRKLLRK